MSKDINQIKIMAEILKFNGYKNIYSTTESEKICDFCDEHEIDLIILDESISDSDVMFFLRTDQRCAEILVVMLFECEDMNSISRALMKGVNDYIIKPFDKKEGVVCVRQLLDVYCLHKKYSELISKRLISDNHKVQIESVNQ